MGQITFDLAHGHDTTVIQRIEVCVGGHKVDGKTPQLLDIHLDKRTCDCGRMKYVAEQCGCASNPHKELKGYPNE